MLFFVGNMLFCPIDDVVAAGGIVFAFFPLLLPIFSFLFCFHRSPTAVDGLRHAVVDWMRRVDQTKKAVRKQLIRFFGWLSLVRNRPTVWSGRDETVSCLYFNHSGIQVVSVARITCLLFIKNVWRKEDKMISYSLANNPSSGISWSCSRSSQSICKFNARMWVKPRTYAMHWILKTFFHISIP